MSDLCPSEQPGETIRLIGDEIGRFAELCLTVVSQLDDHLLPTAAFPEGSCNGTAGGFERLGHRDCNSMLKDRIGFAEETRLAVPQDNGFATWLATQLAIAGYEVWCDVTELCFWIQR
jgi:hypothetical protein